MFRIANNLRAVWRGGRSTAAPDGPPMKQKANLRLWVQIAFSALCLWVGVEFHLFIKYLESGGALGSAHRPPGVEGFLPISSLMSIYDFILTGDIHAAHPAGFFILSGILAVSLLFGKTFCSWLCPAGLISESLGDLGDRLFGRRLKLPRWLDYPLRSVKYLLLGFFVYSIFFLMTSAALRQFLNSDYNLIADVKMYYFFADITGFALTVIVALVALSVVIRNFWCRYLCPYGALLGMISLLSPHKIKRDAALCADCGECAQACPSFIKVNELTTVISDECSTCMSCTDVCPVPQALDLKPVLGRGTVSKRRVALVVVGLFILITGLGMATGYWHSSISTADYLRLQPQVKTMGHPTSESDISELNRDAAGGR